KGHRPPCSGFSREGLGGASFFYPEPCPAVAGRSFRVGKGGGRSRRRRPGDTERKGLPAAAGPIRSPRVQLRPVRTPRAQVRPPDQALGGASSPGSSSAFVCPYTPIPWWKLSDPPSHPATPTTPSITNPCTSPHGHTAASGSGHRSHTPSAAS